MNERSRKLFIFNDPSKKSNDRIKVCICIKTFNLYELILALDPLCYKFYNLYSANSVRREFFGTLGPHFGFCLHFGTLYVAKTTEPAKNLMQSAFAKKLIIGRG